CIAHVASGTWTARRVALLAADSCHHPVPAPGIARAATFVAAALAVGEESVASCLCGPKDTLTARSSGGGELAFLLSQLLSLLDARQLCGPARPPAGPAFRRRGSKGGYADERGAGEARDDS